MSSYSSLYDVLVTRHASKKEEKKDRFKVF